MVKHVGATGHAFSPRLVEANRAMVGPAAVITRKRLWQNANDLLSVIGKQYPFLVYVTGQVEYPEDDPLYGMHVTEGTLVGKAKPYMMPLSAQRSFYAG